MKERIEMRLLYELSAIKIVKAEIEKYKQDREHLLIELNDSKDVGSVDYGKWKVDGNGKQTPLEIQMKELINTNANIMALENLINILEATAEKKKECVMSVLTEREKIIFQYSFIENRTSEDISEMLGISYQTISRDRKEVIRKIKAISSQIMQINSNFIQNGM